MLKTIFKIIAIFVIGLVGGIFADQIFWPYFIERPLFYQYQIEQSPIYLTEKKEIIIREDTALKDAVEKVEKTAIGIISQTKTGETLEGSGLAITSDGLIVTLADLVPQGATSTFFVEGKPVAYQILKRDLKQNLALVKLDASRLPTVSFGDLEKIKLGERVFLVGAVFKQEIKPGEIKPKRIAIKTVNEGIIKNFDESLINTNISEGKNLSGSPLFDIEGNVVGLNTIGDGGEVIAISVAKIKEFTGF